MKVIASHVTEQSTAMGIGGRMGLGQHGLLVLPPDATVGGCFWGLVQGIEGSNQHLINDFADGLPHVGRDPIRAHKIWVEVDLPQPNYENFDPAQLSRIQAQCLLGIPPAGAPAPPMTVYSETKVAVVGAQAQRIGPMLQAQQNNVNNQWALIAPNLPNLTTALAAWLRSPGKTALTLPAVIHPGLNLSNAARDRVFSPANVRAAERCLWEAVGKACCLANNVGMVSVPRGCYVTRSGGGRFVVVPNPMVQAQVRLRPSTVPWL